MTYCHQYVKQSFLKVHPLVVRNELNTQLARRAQRVEVGYVWIMIYSYVRKRQLAAAAG